MKKLITPLLLLLPCINALCQNVQFAGIDQFTKKYYITTDEVRISLTNFNQQNSFTVAFSSIDAAIIIDFNGNFDRHLSIFQGDCLAFLLSNDSIVTAVSPINQSTYPDVGTSNGTGNTLNTIYEVDSTVVKKLIAFPVKAVRVYYNGGYSWITNDSKSSLSEDLANLARNFLNAYEAGRGKWSKTH